MNPEIGDQIKTIEVFSSAPQQLIPTDISSASSNVQLLDSDDLARSGSRSVSESVQRFSGVFSSEAVGSPFQPDLFFRGFSLSPLLGLPQGIALYLDGVRVNEAFGDTASLDLIPMAALDYAELHPGSNPVFGRNTLGAALALGTRSGFDFSGLALNLDGGDFGYRSGSLQFGREWDSVAVYLAAEAFAEDGWRQFSNSRAARLFVKTSWRPTRKTQLDLGLSGADNRLRGNGATPRQLLDIEGREAVFTFPDQSRPRLGAATLRLSHQLEDGTQFVGTGYFRRSNTHSFNGDGTEFEACEEPENRNPAGEAFLCELEDGDEEEVVEDNSGQAVVADESNDSATQNRSRTEQDSYGLSVQWNAKLGSHALTVGGAIEEGDIVFRSSSELASLSAGRGTNGTGIIVGESIVDLRARNDNISAYVQDTWQISQSLKLILAARWNQTQVDLMDQIPTGDLSGRHRFERLNPAVGLNYRVADNTQVFASLSQSTRAPTPVELTCANPEDPCLLPNGFVDDPPLDEVVARTLEFGLRRTAGKVTGSIAAFHSLSDDDIIFITDGSLSNAGYFDNVGETLRQGIEASVVWDFAQHWRADLQLALLAATFEEDFLVSSPNHPVRDPSDDDRPDPSTRQVRAGDDIPLIPAHQFRAGIEWHKAPFTVSLEALGRGNSRYRGDESNVDSERLDGFVIAGFNAEWEMNNALRLYVSVDNLFDTEYETFGVYGEADEVLGEDFEDARRFVGAGAPRRILGGLRWEWH